MNIIKNLINSNEVYSYTSIANLKILKEIIDNDSIHYHRVISYEVTSLFELITLMFSYIEENDSYIFMEQLINDVILYSLNNELSTIDMIELFISLDFFSDEIISSIKQDVMADIILNNNHHVNKIMMVLYNDLNNIIYRELGFTNESNAFLLGWSSRYRKLEESNRYWIDILLFN